MYLERYEGRSVFHCHPKHTQSYIFWPDSFILLLLQLINQCKKKMNWNSNIGIWFFPLDGILKSFFEATAKSMHIWVFEKSSPTERHCVELFIYMTVSRVHQQLLLNSCNICSSGYRNKKLFSTLQNRLPLSGNVTSGNINLKFDDLNFKLSSWSS